jgi:hypothetical protein
VIRFGYVSFGQRFVIAKVKHMSARKNEKPVKPPMNFKTMLQLDVPQGRLGKHNVIVTQILSDLDQIPAGSALKVPLAALTESKANVRSALSRAIHKTKRNVVTASDEEFLYVWNEQE